MIHLPLVRQGPLRALAFRVILAVALVLFVVTIIYLDRDGYRDINEDGLTLLDCFYYAVVSLSTLAAGVAARDRHAAPLDWLVPAALRATEYLLVVAVGLFGDVPPAVVYLLLFTLALHHYDLTARMEKGAPAPGGRGALLGWDGRIVLLTLAALAGQATLGEAVLAGIVGGGFLVGTVADRRTSGAV